MAYFITDEDFTKGRYPNRNIINGIHSIKGKTSVNVLVSNNTNKHIKFNKGECIGHLEPTIEDSVTSDIHTLGQPNTHSTNNVTLQKMMAKQVQLDTFHPPCHELKPIIESKLDTLLKEYASQFAKDTSHRNDHQCGYLWPSIPETIPNCHDELLMGERQNWETPYSKSHIQQ